MVIFKKVKDLQRYLKSLNATQLRVGFTPTMGALHKGHISLIQQSKECSTLSVCSIFVNPTQFNQASDLSAYPITIDKDILMLEKVGCDILFLPSIDEIYPPGLETKVSIELGGLDKVLEGSKRPGHFQGVLQVVKRLIDIVQPDDLYMGEKDFQQLSIIRQMVKLLKIPTKVIGCAIVREKSGLAMSSRNTRLSVKDKKNALEISKTLSFIQDNALKLSIATLEKKAITRLKNGGLKPEYVQIVDSTTLQAIDNFTQVEEARALIAAWAGEVRLIDNCDIIIKEHIVSS